MTPGLVSDNTTLHRVTNARQTFERWGKSRGESWVPHRISVRMADRSARDGSSFHPTHTIIVNYIAPANSSSISWTTACPPKPNYTRSLIQFGGAFDGKRTTRLSSRSREWHGRLESRLFIPIASFFFFCSRCQGARSQSVRVPYHPAPIIQLANFRSADFSSILSRAACGRRREQQESRYPPRYDRRRVPDRTRSAD